MLKIAGVLKIAAFFFLLFKKWQMVVGSVHHGVIKT